MLADISEPKSPPIPQNQTQKLERLGLMASGIAHDFNNLLTSIVCHASLALMKLPPGDTARLHVEGAIKAAEYATVLTRQLRLHTTGACSQDDVVDLNQLVHDNVGFLLSNRLDGATLRLNLYPHLPPVRAEQGKMQQVVTIRFCRVATATILYKIVSFCLEITRVWR